MKRSTFTLTGLFALGLALTGSLCAAETELIDTNTPWRTYLVVGPSLRWQNGAEDEWPSKGGGRLRVGKPGTNLPPLDPATADLGTLGFSPRPPADWMTAAGDVSAWSRYLMGDLTVSLGVYGRDDATPPLPTLLCLRTRFGVVDPDKATDLKLTVTCLGGAVVYVNGKEIGRGFMPDGPIHPLTPATDLPIETYTLPDGVTPMAGNLINATPENRARGDARIRTFTLDVPPSALVKGANVLAIEVHRAAVAGPLLEKRWEWTHLSVHDVRLVSASGAGAIAYAEASRGTHLWSANPEQQVSPPPLLPRGAFSWGNPAFPRNSEIRGITQGNPFDPLLPVRLALPRNGVGSGQVVLTDQEGLRDVSVKVGPLKGPAGVLPAGAVEIRYAGPSVTVHYCDALLPKPPATAKTLPVWTIVQAPKDQAPGWYSGTLDITANAKTFSVPLQVLVTAALVPDAREFTTPMGVAHSPDSVAGYYKVKLWSEEHFRLMESSLRMAGQLSNVVVQVPVILGDMYPPVLGKGRGELQPLVRWVKTGDKLAPEFSLLEKYLDVYLKHCAPPKAISFYVWEASSIRQKSLLDLRNSYLKKTPLRVLQWDPATGATTPMPAPEFEDEGAAAFWRPLLDGLRAVVTKRGWSDRVIVLSLGGDTRPSPKTGELLREWAPYARWHIASHFGADPGPKNGKLIAIGGLEVGLAVQPWLPLRTTEVLERRMAGVPTHTIGRVTEAVPPEFIEQSTLRTTWLEASPPMAFRQLPLRGDLGQIGLDFWLKVPESPMHAAPRVGGNNGVGGNNALLEPGPDGPVPTVRFQLFREGVQDMELRWMIIRALLAKPEDQRKPYRDLLDEHLRRGEWARNILSQFELQYDWRAYAARVQQTAAELAGQTTQARWETPPATEETR
jgi:hypothetical protein